MDQVRVRIRGRDGAIFTVNLSRQPGETVAEALIRLNLLQGGTVISAELSIFEGTTVEDRVLVGRDTIGVGDRLAGGITPPPPRTPSLELGGRAGQLGTFGEFLTERGFGAAGEPSRARDIGQRSFEPLRAAFTSLGQLGQLPTRAAAGPTASRFQNFLGDLPSIDPRFQLREAFSGLLGANPSALAPGDPLRAGLLGTNVGVAGDISNTARQLFLSNFSPLVFGSQDIASSDELLSNFLQAGRRTDDPFTGQFAEFANRQLGLGRF